MGILNLFSKGAPEENLINKGNEYYKSNKLNQALDTYNQILKNDPQNIDAICMKSIVLYDLKQFQESVDIVERSFSLFGIEPPLNSSDSNWWKNIAESFLQDKKYLYGLPFCNASLFLNPTEDERLYLKADLLYRCGQFEKAIDCMGRYVDSSWKETQEEEKKYNLLLSQNKLTPKDRGSYFESQKKQMAIEEVFKRMHNRKWGS
jgi:tetratricopeptide (TPR) repeat protein